MEIIPVNNNTVTDEDKTNKELEKNAKAVLELTEKFKYEIMRCVNCPVMFECSHPRKRLDTLREEAKKLSEEIYQEEIELDNSAENVLRAQDMRDETYKNIIRKRAPTVLSNDRCIFERREVLSTLEKFSNAGYDISDPRSYIIIQESEV